MSFESKIPCIWHAFTGLDGQNTGTIAKGRLKVLTHSIANCLGVVDVQKKIDQHQEKEEKETVTFEDYCKFLEECIFTSPENENEQNANVCLTELDRICWDICHAQYKQRANPHLPDVDVYNLWLVCNFLCETDDRNHVLIPVTMHTEEIAMVIQHLLSIVSRTFDKEQYLQWVNDEETLTFDQVLDVIEHRYCHDLDSATTKVMFKDIHEEYIDEVIKKGILMKKAAIKHQDRYFTLQPHVCTYYTPDRKEERGSIPITAQCQVMDNTSQTRRPSFLIKTQTEHGQRVYELFAHSPSERTAWMEAFRTVISLCNQPYTPRTKERLQRKQKRQEQRERRKEEAEAIRLQEEERIRLKQSLDESQLRNKELHDQMENKLADLLAQLTKIQQEREKVESELEHQTNEREQDQHKLQELDQERSELERKLLEETSLREALKRQVKELHEIQLELKKQRDDAEQAKKDEEMARNAQSRFIAEELEKREELEKLKVEMERQLAAQQRAAEGIQIVLQAQQHAMMTDLTTRLQQLELEKKKKEQELQESLLKQQEAEKEKLKLEDRVQAVKKEHSLSNKLAKIIGLNLDMPSPETVSHRDRSFAVGIDLQFAEMKKKRNHSEPSPTTSPVGPPLLPRKQNSLPKCGGESRVVSGEPALNQLKEIDPEQTESSHQPEPSLQGRKVSVSDDDSANCSGDENDSTVFVEVAGQGEEPEGGQDS